MKFDHFTGGVTLDFRDLLEGWTDRATSTIAFFVALGAVGSLWPRGFRTDQKVVQVLWPAKCFERTGSLAGFGSCRQSRQKA